MLSPCNDLLMDSICFAKCLINIEKIENRFVAFRTAFGEERETMTSNPNLSFEQLTLLLDPIIQLLFHLLKYIYSFFICIYIYNYDKNIHEYYTFTTSLWNFNIRRNG